MDRQAVFEKLRTMLCEMLGLDEDEVSEESYLIEELGAESLDLLDLSFQIEEEFGINIDPNEFSARAKSVAESEIFEEDGRTFNAKGLEILKAELPEVPAEKFAPGLSRTRLPRLLNVAVFVSLILRKMGEGDAQG